MLPLVLYTLTLHSLLTESETQLCYQNVNIHDTTFIACWNKGRQSSHWRSVYSVCVCFAYVYVCCHWSWMCLHALEKVDLLLKMDDILLSLSLQGIGRTAEPHNKLWSGVFSAWLVTVIRQHCSPCVAPSPAHGLSHPLLAQTLASTGNLALAEQQTVDMQSPGKQHRKQAHVEWGQWSVLCLSLKQFTKEAFVA